MLSSEEIVQDYLCMALTRDMDKLLSDNLWPTIKRLAKKSSAKRAAVAYVTSEEYVKFGDGDVLITDASDQAIASGQTNAKLLARAHRRRAQLFSLPALALLAEAFFIHSRNGESSADSNGKEILERLDALKSIE
jgi:hypothetical protein